MIQDAKIIDIPFHKKLIEYLKVFLVTGGMPEVVAKYIDGEPLLEIQTVLDELQASILADFVKYKKMYHQAVSMRYLRPWWRNRVENSISVKYRQIPIMVKSKRLCRY